MTVSIGVLKVERVGYVGCAQTFSKEERIAMKLAAAGRRIPFVSHIVRTIARVYSSGGYLRWFDLKRVDCYLSIWQNAKTISVQLSSQVQAHVLA